MTQTDPLPANHISMKDFDRIQDDLEDFKRYTHGEILSMKADVANRQKSPNPNSTTPMDKDREALVRSLQERILSLEKQLQDKQYIIERLLDGPRHRSTNITTSPYTIPTGSKNHAPCATTIEEQSAKPTMKNSLGTKTLENTKEPDKRNANTANKDTKQQEKQSSSTKSKQKDTKSRKRIAIIGDSMLNGIYEEGMQKDHNVRIKPHSGATTRDIVDYLKPVIRKKPDCIIIHAGTNDLTSKDQIDTVQNFNTMIEDVKRDSPESVIVLSTAVIRKDKQAMDKKVSVPELNKKIKEIAKAEKISVIDNSSLDASCLSRKKLHLNEKGNSYLAKHSLQIFSFVQISPGVLLHALIRSHFLLKLTNQVPSLYLLPRFAARLRPFLTVFTTIPKKRLHARVKRFSSKFQLEKILHALDHKCFQHRRAIATNSRSVAF